MNLRPYFKDNNQPYKPDDYPKDPLQRTNNRRSLIRWIREIRVLYKNTIPLLHNDRVSHDLDLRLLRRDCIAAPASFPVSHYALKHRVARRTKLDSNGGNLPNRISFSNHHTIHLLLCPCRFVARYLLATTRRFPTRPASAHTQGSDPYEGSGQCAVSHLSAP